MFLARVMPAVLSQRNSSLSPLAVLSDILSSSSRGALALRQTFVWLAVVLLAAWGGTPAVQAQATAQFSYSIATLGGGFSGPTGMALDKSGNLYVVDYYNNAVYEMPSGCISQSCVTTLGGGFSSPSSVTVDGGGNVYVTDWGTHGVYEMPANCTSAAYAANGCAVTQLGGGFKQPSGIAVDGRGNVYVADYSNSQVYEIPLGCTSTSYSNNACTVTLGGGFSAPYGLAMDGSGNLYIGDTGTDAVYEMPANCTSSMYSNNTCAVTQLGGGFNQPTGVAVDGSGNVYVSDSAYGGVTEMPPGCTSAAFSANTCTITTLAGGFEDPQNVVVDGSGNVYVADFLASTVNEIVRSGVNLGSVAVGAASAPTTLNFTFTGAGGINAPVVLTGGAPNLDFTDAGTGTCDSVGASYDAGDTCTMNVTFTPTKAGPRKGGVELLNSSGAVIANAFVYGTGVGPQVAFGPATQSTLGGGFSAPGGLAVDGSGNVYVADAGNNAVKEMSAGCAASGCVTPLGGAFYSPAGVAVDGSGNVYVADTGHNVVKEMPPACASSTCVATLGGGFGSLYGLAVDGSGSVYIADTFNNAVKEMPAGCASSSCVTTLGGGFGLPTGVAVDGSGNVYVSDYGNNAVYEMPAGCASSACVTTLGGGFSEPSGVAVDGSGNVYVADQGDNAVKEMPAGCASSSCVTMLSGSFSAPDGVTVDGNGNVYVANNSGSTVVELNVSAPPSLSFASTPVGSESSGPQTVMLANIGNAPLSLLTPSTGTNPSLSTGFSLDSATTCPEISSSSAAGTLAAGTSCALAVDFVPTSPGPISGALTLMDNNLNASPSATQAIPLSGTATQAPQTITFNPIPSQTAGQSLNLTASSNSDLAVSFTSLTTAVCSVSNTTAKMLTAGTCTIEATQAGNAAYAAATPVPQSFMVTAASQTITFNPVSSQSAGQSVGLTASASSGLAVSFASLTTAVCSVSGTTANLLTTGTCTIEATQGGNAVYAAATPVSQSFSVSAGFTITALPGSENISVGVLAAFLLELKSVDGFAGNVTLSCSGGPSGSTCADLPMTVKVDGTALAISGVLFPAKTPPGTYTMTFTGVSGSQTASGTAQFIIPLETPTLAFAAVPSKTYGAASFAVGATSNSTGAITYSVVSGPAQMSGDAVTLTGTGTVELKASLAATSTYAAATATTSFSVAAEAPTLAFKAIASQTDGTKLDVSATSDSTGAITYSVVSGPATVSGDVVTLTGTGTVDLKASQAAAGDYTEGTVTTSFSVAK